MRYTQRQRLEHFISFAYITGFSAIGVITIWIVASLENLIIN